MGSEIIIVPTIIIALVAIVKTLSNNKLKRQIIERGQLENLDALKVLNTEDYDVLSPIKWGLALVGVGLALLIANLGIFHINDETTVGLMFLFAGSAFLIYHQWAKRERQKGQGSE